MNQNILKEFVGFFAANDYNVKFVSSHADAVIHCNDKRWKENFTCGPEAKFYHNFLDREFVKGKL